MFIISLILFLLTLGAITASILLRGATHQHGYGRGGEPNPGPSRAARLAAAVLGVLAILALAASTLYTQSVTEAKVIKSWSGEVVGQDSTPGLGTKAPWHKTVTFDVRNQVIAYVGNGKDDYQGSKPDGARITTTDGSGAQVNIDASMTYGLNREEVGDIHDTYQTQERLVEQKVSREVRAVVREIPAQFPTDVLRFERGKVAEAMRDELDKRLSKVGIVIESVQLQEVKYGKDVDQKYADLANAKTEQATAVTTAETKRIEAEGEAQANRIKTASLTPEVLKLREIEMHEKLAAAGNLMIVEGGTDVMVQAPERPADEPTK